MAFCPGEMSAKPPIVLSDEFPFVHIFNFLPNEQVYVRIRMVLYGNEELEEEPWVVEDYRIDICDEYGSCVTVFEVDIPDEFVGAAGLLEVHGMESGKYARQRIAL